MNTTFIYAILSVIAVSAISLIGLFAIPLHSRFGHKLLRMLVSFSVGALLGDVFIHLLPELAESNRLNLGTSSAILFSILGFFVFEKLIHWHHHHNDDPEEEANHAKYHPVVFLNLLGDGLHNLIDGLIIGSAYLVSIDVGIATTVAVLLHEIPQEFGDFGILIHGGLSRSKALFYNFLSGLAAIGGAIIVFLLGSTENLSTVLIALGMGSFIYVALADLIPAIQKTRGKIWSQIFSVAFGVSIMYLLLLLD